MNKEVILKFLERVVNGKVNLSDQVNFLDNFTPEKITAEHIKIFVDFMMKNMPEKLDMPGAIDICGTGGSGLPRINTSTISAFMLADLGVGIAKHGNKAVSGRFGSFDLLESLEIDFDKTGGELEKSYRKHNLAFIFARKFHPVMKNFAEARILIKKPTIFNLIGPLVNPANVKMQIIGTSFKNQMRLIAEACKLLGKERIMVVRGQDGLDEVTVCAETDVVELKDGKIFEYTIKPEDFGIKTYKSDKIFGGDNKVNKKIALEILANKCKSPHKDLVYTNVALALRLTSKIEDLCEAYNFARTANGIKKLNAYKGDILGEISSQKILNHSERSFKEALKGKNKVIIAEIKKASPSEGVICDNFDPKKIAEIYEKNNVAAISVLTDKNYFQGSFENLQIVKNATKNTPLLCKDFIVEEYQIYKAREFGADAILLIATILPVHKIKQFKKLAEKLKMDSLIEVHNEKDIKKALKAGAEIIGINNRDLKTFKVDINTTNSLIQKIPNGKIIVSESGINNIEDIKKLDRRINAVLVGTSLMKAKNLSEKLKELTKT